MINTKRMAMTLGAGIFAAGFAGSAWADSIDPTSFSADLADGESVTIEKTVTVSAGDPTSAKLDVMFLVDTTGSMGAEIDAAKAAAASILSGLSGFGDLASGVGVFGEYWDGSAATSCGSFCGYDESIRDAYAITSDLSTSTATTDAAISAITLSTPDYGYDGDERGNDGLIYQAEETSWRSGSTRFVVALGDAPWKDDVASDADVIAAMAAEGITLIGLDYGSMSSSITDLGGTAYAGGYSTADLVDTITSSVSTAFSTYSEVTVDDLGGGDPYIDVSVECKTADGVACSGDTATGSWDRSAERDFVFDVTFTRTADGDHAFDTYALVDGGIVASEADRFGGDDMSPIPLPAAGWLLLGGLGSLLAMARRRTAA